MQVTIYRSDTNEQKLCRSEKYNMQYIDTDVNEVYGHPDDIEANIINIHDDIGHISKFVKRGAKVINSSSYTEKLDYCAFKNPDGEIVLPVMNSKDKGFNLIIRLDGHIYKTNIPAHSIATFIINK